MQHDELIRLLQEKRDDGAQQLLEQYGALIRYVIAPILADERDREECLSETVIKVWQGINSYNSQRGTWTAWLTSVARNTALNFRRRTLAQPDAGEIPADAPSADLQPEEEMLRRERQERIRAAISNLSDKDKALFYRKYYYMQPTAQIAAELGLTARAVEGRLYRLRRQLREMLGGEADG